MAGAWTCLAAGALGLLLAACGGKETPDMGDTGRAPPDTGDSGGADTGDSGSGADTGDTGQQGTALVGRLGQATVVPGSSYEGSEEWYAVDEGSGEDLCRVRYTFTGARPVADCADCDWAFELTIGKVELLAESGPGCEPFTGFPGSDAAELQGSTVGRGYTAEYMGHAEVLMVDLGGGSWSPVSFASFDSASGDFSYDWQDGHVSY